ncbi:DUF4347 domain-containing protein, partial [Nostoc sp.]|uniref:DUF4347 domain-containing protein n=1 Tax=Nostoc sp. TaxID=1180 RepID=UPI002FF6951F
MKNHIQSRSSATTLEKFPDHSSYLLSQPQNSVSMLVVIDPRVEDYPMLAGGVHEGANVLILDLHRDGVEQITEMLVDHPASALHIVCHGSPGCLALGNTYLNLETLNYYSRELQAWSAFLASAPVFLYGCNVAAGEVGEAFLARLHYLTRANIAASANPTGSAKKGGNWELEVTLGDIEGPLAFSEAVREAYTSVLSLPLLSLTLPNQPLTEGDTTPQTLAVGINLGVDSLGVPIATLADATITLTPNAQLNLGNGPGKPVNVTIAAGSTAANIQNVPVLAINDGIVEGSHTGTISATISSTNPILNALPSASVTANINDPVSLPVLSLTLPNQPLTEGDTTPQTLAVGINLGVNSLGVPIATLADATITLTPNAQLNLGNGPGKPVNVTIAAGSTAANIQNVPVLAINDGIVEGSHTGTISATISSTNPILNALPSASVTANINDPVSLPVLSLTLPNQPLTEGDTTPQTLAVDINLGVDSLGVPIATLADATITLTPNAQLNLGNGPGKPVNVTIAAGSTAANIQNVPVLAINDGIVEGSHTGTISATISSTNPILNALPSASVTANINDPVSLPVLSLTLPNQPLTEGDTTPQTLAVGINLGLDSLGLPIHTQAAATITLDPDDQLDLGNGVGKPVNVTIAAGSTATDIQNVAVLAVNDGVVEGNHTGTIKATISSANPILNALPSVSVTANINDPLSNGTGSGGTGSGGTGSGGTGSGGTGSGGTGSGG